MNAEQAGVLLSAVSAAAVAVVGIFLKRRIQEVHVLVNARMADVMGKLTSALADNVRLKADAGEQPGPPAVVPIFTPATLGQDTTVVGVLVKPNTEGE